jgi:serine phosphatase RsbU (regulator of sigma subunit)
MKKNTGMDSMNKFHRGIIDELINFKGENPYNDDVTLLSVRFKN